MSGTAFAERLDSLAVPSCIVLTSLELAQVEEYYHLLEKWNEKVNLTGLPLQGFPTATLNRLLIEPLAAARLVADELLDWFDLGSGGGSPAIPLKVVRPRARLTMVESSTKKASFLREAVRTLNLPNATVRAQVFAEVAREQPAAADLVTVRAVKLAGVNAGIASAILRPGGRLFRFGPATAPVHSIEQLSFVDVFRIPGTGASIQIFRKPA